MKKKDKKNRIIIALLLAVVFMSAGYAYLAVDFEQKSNNTVSRWDVKVTTINSIETMGKSKSVKAAINNKSTVAFTTKLLDKEDVVSYYVNVKNEGTLNARLESIDIINTNMNEYITYNIDGISAGDVLKSGQSKMITIKATSIDEIEEIPTDKTISDVIVLFNFVQE